MSTSNTSFGIKVGRALGTAAAYGVHGAIKGAQLTGQFGKDVAAGAGQSYAEKTAALADQRKAAMLAALARREEAVGAAIEPVVVKPAARQRKLATAKA